MELHGDEKLKRVVVRAPLLSKSGYGVHSRQVFKYLLTKPGIDLYTQIVPWGITPWNTASDAFEGLAGEALNRSTTTPDQKFDVSFQVQLPNEWDASLAVYNVGVTAGVETDVCNPTWTSVHCSKMDLVIVPSLHTKVSLENSGKTKTPITVVPEHYFHELEDEPISLDLDLNSEFNFLAIGVLTGLTAFTDRKNLFYLIKWFVEEFQGHEDVGLVIKTNRGRETTIDKSLTRVLLKSVLDEIGHKEVPHVYLLHGDMSREEMNGLYKHPQIKALVSTTRGEGFGLPLLEASTAGLPVVATDWSAHTEFLNSGRWIKLDYEISPIHESRCDKNIFMPNAKWAEVKEESFKRALRKFRSSHFTPKKWAIELSETLKQSHCEKAVFACYEEALGAVLR
jgi:glycosyltransferase involved in cell wall biosynthesis